MSVQTTEPVSVLRADTLNVVGEFHSESQPRRALEKQFVFEKIGSKNYWTEYQLKDEPMALGIRKKLGGEGYAKKSADLMELRAAHGVALLMEKYDGLCAEARRVSAITDATAGPAVLAFIDKNYRAFAKEQQALEKTWEPTESADLNKAVKDVYDRITHIRQSYFGVLRRAHEKLEKHEMSKEDEVKLQLTATQHLADSRADVYALLSAVLIAVGVDGPVKASQLEEMMRDLRSAFMGLAGGIQAQTGVWKVGQGHIDDLKSGAVKVDMSRANYVTRQDFNKEFDAWNDLRLDKLKTKQ